MIEYKKSHNATLITWKSVINGCSYTKGCIVDKNLYHICDIDNIYDENDADYLDVETINLIVKHGVDSYYTVIKNNINSQYAVHDLRRYVAMKRKIHNYMTVPKIAKLIDMLSEKTT